MLSNHDSFVKLPHSVLAMDMPAEAKILYCVLADRINYSRFSDDQGQYYFLSGKERKALMTLIGCKRDAFMKYLRLLKNNGLIATEQHGYGSRFYLLPRWSKKSTTDAQVVEKIDYRNTKKSTTEEVEKIDYSYNQLTKTNKQNNTNIIDIYDNVSNYVIPQFVDVLLYWRQKHYHSSPAEYFDYYNLQGWKINKEPVKDWKKLADKWEERQY